MTLQRDAITSALYLVRAEANGGANKALFYVQLDICCPISNPHDYFTQGMKLYLYAIILKKLKVLRRKIISLKSVILPFIK